MTGQYSSSPPPPLSPLARIAVGLGIVTFVALIPMSWASSSPWTALLLLALGTMIGPFLGLAFPFDPTTKLLYIGALVLAIVLVGLGLRWRARWLGQGMVIVGLIVWAVAGLMGLGTAT